MDLQTKMKLCCILILIIFPISSAWTKFIIEPSYNYYHGRFDSENGRGNLTGHVYGVNFGYLGEYFMAGVSIETGKYQYDNHVTVEKYRKFDGGGAGTFVGFHIFDRIKLWTGYLNSTLEPIDNNDIRYFGQHFSYGIGYRIYDGIMLNLYEFKNQFTQIEDDNTGKTNGLNPSIKTQGSNLSISYILVF